MGAERPGHGVALDWAVLQNSASNYMERGDMSKIETEWYSTWQTNDPKHQYQWASELIRARREGDAFEFENTGNNFHYHWRGSGNIHRTQYVTGHWWSAKEGSTSAGTFMLHIADPQGRMRTGFLLGPDQGDRKNFGAWVMVRKDQPEADWPAAANDLEAAKRLLASSLCPGLGDLIGYADGRFIESLLHGKVRPGLQLLNSGDVVGAVSQAFGQLVTYVRDRAGLDPKLDMLNVMKKAFELYHGKLSNGPIRPGQNKFAEDSEQHRMCDLFKGSLYVRNLYAHNPPSTSVTEAVNLLLIASYLYTLVDRQAAKRGRTGTP